MQTLSLKEITALMNFLYGLPDGYGNFPDHVLELIDRYFPFHKLTFIPLNSSFASLNNSDPDTWFNEIRTRGLTDAQLTQYYTRGVETDPFRVRNLPVELHFKPVIRLEEAFPEDSPRSVRYRNFLKNANVPYQTILNLVYENIRLGVISVYRSEDEGPFTHNEIWLLNQLSRFIAQHYMIAISQTSRHLAEELFDSCYQNVDFGAIILDSKRNVIKFNSCAHEFCSSIYKYLFLGSDTTSKENQNDSYVEQYVLDQFRDRLSADSEHVIVPVNNQLFDCRINSFISVDEHFSKVGLNHLLFIFQSTYVPETEKLNHSVIKSKLTDREWEIAILISQGLSNQEIAEQIFISLNTVKTHIQHIYEKLNVPNRISLMQLLSDESKYQY